jgi:hypothetical protein
LLNQGWTKKAISVPGEVHFTKTINNFMLIEVVITTNQNNFLNISIYNTTGIGKERITQRYSQNFSKLHIQSIAMCLDSTMPMLIEDVVVKFIKSILQKK